MISGFYSSGTGMISQSIAMEHLTSNITGALVPGYKKQEVLFHSFDRELDEAVTGNRFGARADDASGLEIIQGVTDFSQGPMKYTGRKGDMAIDGPGFFKVDTGKGIFYTRAGKFRVGENLSLVTPEGYTVLSEENAPIAFNKNIPHVGQNIGVREDGRVFVMDRSQNPVVQVEGAKIALVEFEDPGALTRVGNGLWHDPDDTAGAKPSPSKLRDGYLEMANTQPVASMVEMIVNQRLYDANANALKEIHRSMADFLKAVTG